MPIICVRAIRLAHSVPSLCFLILAVASLSVAAPPWSPRVPLNDDWTTDGASDFMPTVASGGASTVLCAWNATAPGIRATTGPAVMIARSADRGETWQSPVEASRGTGAAADRIRLAGDKRGTWILAYAAGTPARLTVIRSTDDGRTWLAPVQFDTETAIPGIATDGQGNWMVTSGKADKVVIRYSANNGQTWSTRANLTVTGQQAFMSSHVVYVNSRWLVGWSPYLGTPVREPRLAESFSGGYSWTTRRMFAATVTENLEGLATDGNLNLFAVMTVGNATVGYHGKVWASLDVGQTWTAGPAFPTNTTAGLAVAANPAGNAVALLKRITPLARDAATEIVALRTANRGRTWEPAPAPIMPTTDIGSLACVGPDRWLAVAGIHPMVTGELGTYHDPEIFVSTATLAWPKADLDVVKTHVPANPVARDSDVTFTIHVANLGPDTATGATVADYIPEGLVVTSAASTSGTVAITDGDVFAQLGDLPPGADATVTVGTHVTWSSVPATLGNTVFAESDAEDLDWENSTDTDPLMVRGTPDVSVTPMFGTYPGYGATVTSSPAGMPVICHFAVRNQGPDTAYDVGVTATLPAGLEIISRSVSQNVPILRNGSTFSAKFPHVSANVVAWLDVLVWPEIPGPLEISGMVSTIDLDPVASNNQASSVLTVTQGVADLSLTSFWPESTATVGSKSVFPFYLQNKGPSTMRNLRVQARMSPGLGIVETTAPKGGSFTLKPGGFTFDLPTTWTSMRFAEMAAVTVVPRSGGTFTIVARTDSPYLDPTPQDNVVTRTIVVPLPAFGPDLVPALSRTSARTIGAGARARDLVMWTGAVTNAGNRASTASTTVRFVLSDDPVPDETDRELGWMAVTTLQPGRRVQRSFSLYLPAGVRAADKYLVAVADPTDRVAERDEPNNVVVAGPLVVK